MFSRVLHGCIHWHQLIPQATVLNNLITDVAATFVSFIIGTVVNITGTALDAVACASGELGTVGDHQAVSCLLVCRSCVDLIPVS